MIYVFTCVKEICGLPGKLCTECSKLCNQLNCQPCQEVCDAAANCCRGFLDKPLSSYVLITSGLSFGELASCASAFNAPELRGCEVRTSDSPGPEVGVHSWLVGQMAFAGINLLFAPYFQNQVWHNLVEQVQSLGPAQAKVPKKVVQNSFKHVFLHDFGVLFYFFTLIGSFIWSLHGQEWRYRGPSCNPDGATEWAAYLGTCLFWVAFFYSLCWYWCECCARSVDPSALGLGQQEYGQPVPGGPAAGFADASQALYYGQGHQGTQAPLGFAGVPAAPQRAGTAMYYAPVQQGYAYPVR
mmetsp:Transcript_86681/g.240377  ORF Transcript_86681/g.240377 Transcript_86681/m.240377 type:complete len:298 (-) Transcript_86681:160-1053(-)